MEKTGRNRTLLLISAVMVFATLIAYEPIRHNGFVGYDDDGYITKNPDLQQGLTQKSIIWAFTSLHAANWHPLTWLSHIADCQLFRLNPAGHHSVSVLFHILNALLLFRVLTGLTGSMWTSGFVAGIFALHPLQVESVAWAAERKNVLSGFFWFLTMAVYIWYTKRPGIWRYIAVFAIYGLSIMTKPMVVTLPFVLLLLDYWPLNRFTAEHAETAEKKNIIKKLIVEKIPLFALSAISSMITVIAQRAGGAISSLTKTPLDLRIINVFVSYVQYVYTLIWPARLAAFYPYYQRNFGDATVIFSISLFVLITIVCLYLGRKRKYIVVGWLWFVGTLVPMIGLVQVGSQSMADRYMYISMIGLLIIIAWSVKELIAKYSGLKHGAAAAAVAVLFVAVVLTRTQVKHWENNLTLFGYALEVTDRNFLAESSYGMALLEVQRTREAEEHIKNAIKISPRFSDAYSNLGTVYIQLGRYGEAVNNLQKAIELKSDNAKALNNYAWLLATQKEVSADNAAKSVELAFRACAVTKNKDPEMLDTLAVAYAAAGRFADAIKISNQAIGIAKVIRQDKLVDEIQSRIKLYRENKRYQMQ